MRTTIYISDALADQIKGLKDQINVSAVCSAALEREIQMIKTAAEAEAVQYTDEDGITHQFSGTRIAWDDDGRSTVVVYVTKGERIAVITDDETLTVFDTFEDFEEVFDGRALLVSSVADALNIEWVDVLDI